MLQRRSRNASTLLLFSMIAAALGGCAAERVMRPVELVAASAEATIAEEQLLDIGIELLAPVSEVLTDNEASLHHLRLAESHYLSWQLAQTLQRSGHWGSIRLNPLMLRYTDLRISGTLLQSDGETLRLRIEAVDATGRRWLDREYQQLSNEQSYVARVGEVPPFPFQALLNEIANDILAVRHRELESDDLSTIRNMSALTFAADFLPEAYAAYIRDADGGRYEASRLPAADDPVYTRIADIRARNELFLDAIQAQYEVFARQVDEPYRRFLARSERISKVLNASISARDAELEYGASVMDGDRDVGRQRYGSRIAYEKRSDTLNMGSNAKIYAAALADGGAPFEMDVHEHTLEIASRTITLSGTIEEQYEQWRRVLAEMHALDTAP